VVAGNLLFELRVAINKSDVPRLRGELSHLVFHAFLPGVKRIKNRRTPEREIFG
jgi:hypothetical protein